jgi:protein-disulfide isomerase/uncharacterized membrane protein
MSDMGTQTIESPQTLQDNTTASLVWCVGLLLLVAAAAASGIMALKGLGVLGDSLPGCGPESACDAITRGPFGSIPGIGWPVSFLGFAYFCGLIIAWSGCLGGVSIQMRWLIRLGVLASLMFIGVMIVDGALCPYCLTTHLCNIAFWGLVEFSPGRRCNVQLPSIVAWFATFSIVSLALGFGDAHRTSILEPMHAELRQQNEDAIIAAGQAAQTTHTETTQPNNEPFTGRYLLGPQDAAVKIVMFSDYQCTDCQRFERMISRILDRRDDVSLSIKHFPFNSDCNEYANSKRHPMACVAAQAVETAGILGGPDAYWQWHDFLLMNKGQFEPGKARQDLPSLVEEMGWDKETFAGIMFSDNVQDLVKEDIEEAQALGIFFTPMIFINGVQYKWAIPGTPGLTTVVDRIATAIENGTADAPIAQPDTVVQKYVSDWRDAPVQQERAGDHSFRMNDSADAIRITVYGDYVSDKTKWLLDEVNTASTNTGIPVSIEVRVYPLDRACNAALASKLQSVPGACMASRALKAAGIVGGIDAHAAFHDWAFANQPELQNMDEGSWAALAAQEGMDPGTFVEVLMSPEVNRLIALDIAEFKRLGHRHLPTILIEQKFMPRWFLKDEPVIDRVLIEAKATRTQQP